MTVGRLFSIAACFFIPFALANGILAPIAGAVTYLVPGDFDTIQEALDAAPPGSVIEVLPGTYSGPLNRNLDFHGKALELRSRAGAAATIIDCAYGGRGVWFDDGEASTAVLDGFTIRDGHPPGSPNHIGGCIFCAAGSSPTIRRCIIEGPYIMEPGSRGAGIACIDGAAPVISECTITGGDASFGSGVYCNGASPSIDHTMFRRNGTNMEHGDGGGLYCEGGSVLSLVACTFIDNDAGGSGFGGGIGCVVSALRAERCVFTGNGAEGGGGIAAMGSTVEIIDCTLEENQSDNNGGSGILACADYIAGPSTVLVDGCTFIANEGHRATSLHCWDSEVTVTACTFVRDTYLFETATTIEASGTGLYPAHIAMDHTIIAFGDNASVECDGDASMDLACCDVYGNEGGDWIDCISGQAGTNGNLSADPFFCDLAADNLTLHVSSPCAPPQSGACELIGAWPIGCGAAAVEDPMLHESTWGAIKAGYR